MRGHWTILKGTRSAGIEFFRDWLRHHPDCRLVVVNGVQSFAGQHYRGDISAAFRDLQKLREEFNVEVISTFVTDRRGNQVVGKALARRLDPILFGKATRATYEPGVNG